MPKFIVERTVPKVGDLSPEKLKILRDLAYTALQSFGGRVQWIESFVTEDKIFSILTAPDEAAAPAELTAASRPPGSTRPRRRSICSWM